MSLRVDVHIFEEYRDLVVSSWLEAVASRAYAVGSGGDGTGASLGVVIADDRAVQELNLEHRRLDETTDVLSFAFGHGGEYDDGAGTSPDAGFVLPDGESATLGEVIVSYSQAVRQAAAAGVRVEQELAHLLTHGVLHILGYDHQTPEEHTGMKSLERTALKEIPPMEPPSQPG